MTDRDIYCSTYCNFGHDMDTGEPVDHECIDIPPEVLEAERDGDVNRAIALWKTSQGKEEN